MTHRRLALALTLLGGLLLARPAVAGPPSGGEEAPARRPMLWVIEGDVPVFLFGTIHIPDRRVLDLLPVVRGALEACDIFNGEIPMEPAEFMKAQALMMLPPDQSLDEVLGEELWQRVSTAVEAAGIPKFAALRMKPWVIGLQLMMKALMPDADEEPEAEETLGGGQEGAPEDGEGAPAEEDEPELQAVDQWLYVHAKSTGKEVGGLETVEEQLRIFDGIDADAQIQLITSALDMLDAEDEPEGAEPTEAGQAARTAEAQVDQMLDLYLAGDVEGVGRAMKAVGEAESEAVKEFLRRLIDDRNVIMVDRLLEKRAANPDKVIFIAVGTGHFPGPQGILALLAQRGFQVRRLEANDPVPVPEPAAAGAH